MYSAAGLSTEAMPKQSVADKYAAMVWKQRKRLTTQGSNIEPFPYFEIADLASDWSEAKSASKRTDHKAYARTGFADAASWAKAFQHLALIAAAAGVWDYVSSYTHMRHCMRITAEAKKENLPWWIGLMYDRLVRKKWEDKALRGEPRYGASVP